jgi:hypothetical protein
MRILFVSLFAVIVLAAASFRTRDTNNATEFDLLDKIEQAQKLVKKETVQMVYGVVGTQRVKVGRHKYAYVPVKGIVGREMAIALVDARGSLHIVRAVKNDQGLQVETSGFVLAMRRENGINSDIGCIEPQSGKVLAIKYPVDNEGGRFGPGPAVIEAVYTPYSGEIKSEHIVRRGIEVQSEFVEKAYRRLRDRSVYSRAFPGRRVVDVIPRQVLTVLLMNEHIDPGDFRSELVTRPLVERVLTVIATNRDKAYTYSVSSAGARGLVQMIPSTYNRIASLYTSAGLMSSFVQGTEDPVNAVMAQVLLCDSDWCAIKERADIPAERIGPYLAAAYNGGVGRVLSCLSNDEMDWMEQPDSGTQPMKTVTRTVPVRVKTRRGHKTTYVTKSYSEPIFKAQTNKYVRQYHWINNYFASREMDGFQRMQDDH